MAGYTSSDITSVYFSGVRERKMMIPARKFNLRKIYLMKKLNFLFVFCICDEKTRRDSYSTSVCVCVWYSM